MTVTPAMVLVVDGDPAVREALERLLRSVGLSVSLFESVDEVLAAPLPERPCCLVSEVRFAGHSGLEFQERLMRTLGRPPIVFITSHGDVRLSVHAMKAGAVDFLSKPFGEQELLDAVRIAIEGDRTRIKEEKVMAVLRRRYAALTPRERQVMTLVASGRLNKQIAGELGTREITVKVHRAQAMRKMGARTIADIVRMNDRLLGHPRCGDPLLATLQDDPRSRS